jgi:hypothetical protein
VDIHTTFGAIFATAIFSVALVCVGYILGKLAQAGPSPPSSKQLTELTNCLTQVASIEQHAQRLGQLSRQTPLPVELTTAIDRVVTSIQAIEKRLSAAGVVPFIPDADDLQKHLSAHDPETLECATLHADSVARNLEQIAHMNASRDLLVPTGPGNAYTRIEHVAPWQEGFFPHPSQFVAVQCQRLSAEGLLFDTDEAPTSKRLVVTLGQHHAAVYLLAEVANHRTAIVEGKACCRVQVNFLARLNPPPLPFRSSPCEVETAI